LAEILFLLDIANDILMPMPSFFTERLPVDLRPPELPAPILHRLRLSCLGSSPGMTKIVGSRTNDGSRPPLLRCLALGCAKTPKSLSLPQGERGRGGQCPSHGSLPSRPARLARTLLALLLAFVFVAARADLVAPDGAVHV